jgi:tRNA threonylcarbamoyladenosine biosynthesis protein TsaB
VKLVGIETATSVGSVAFLDGQRIVERPIEGREGVVAALGRLLGEEGVRAAELDGIAVSVGPGSFTGIRLGVAAAQGLCLASGIPALPVGTLEGLAWSCAASDWGLPGTLCLASLDARRAEVYAALYRVAPPGRPPELLWGPEPVSLSRLAATFARVLPEGTSVEAGVLCGDGAGRIRGLFRADSGWAEPQSLSHPRASAIVRAGVERLERGETRTPDDLEPIYLRKTDAEIASEKRSTA